MCIYIYIYIYISISQGKAHVDLDGANGVDVAKGEKAKAASSAFVQVRSSRRFVAPARP